MLELAKIGRALRVAFIDLFLARPPVATRDFEHHVAILRRPRIVNSVG